MIDSLQHTCPLSQTTHRRLVAFTCGSEMSIFCWSEIPFSYSALLDLLVSYFVAHWLLVHCLMYNVKGYFLVTHRQRVQERSWNLQVWKHLWGSGYSQSLQYLSEAINFSGDLLPSLVWKVEFYLPGFWELKSGRSAETQHWVCVRALSDPVVNRKSMTLTIPQMSGTKILCSLVFKK